MRCVRRSALTVALAMLALSAFPFSALAAGPRIMIVYGHPLTKPVIISDWGDNETLMVASNDAMSVSHPYVKGRPYLTMALFWGTEWVQYMNQRKSLSALRPSQANQFARFYPSYGSAPALLVFDGIPGPYTSLARHIRPEGLAVLRRHGIPVRLPLKAGHG
jgi:hypothetical protein